MTNWHTTARAYRWVLVLAVVSPILVAILYLRVTDDNVGLWALATPIVFTCLVAWDARRRSVPRARFWTGLALIPSAFWAVLLLVGLIVSA